MLKAVLFDDERPALRVLERMLSKYPQVQVVGAFSDPAEGIEKTAALVPDVVFLDINMPQISGIDAASAVLAGSPDAEIVFVTAYDEYAVKAFELNALDYLLKPVEPARLEVTLGRVCQRHDVKNSRLTQAGEGQLKLRCLGCFEIELEGHAPVKWRAEKTKELFAFLLHHTSREIAKDEILDSLWRDDNPDKAVKQLYNGIYYIRKTLADCGIDRKQLSIDGSYHMSLGDVDYDTALFCQLYKQKEDRLETLERMEALYAGDYLGSLSYDWAVFEKNRLLDMYIRCVVELSNLYAQRNMNDEAVSKLKKAYQKDPLAENVTQALLLLYRKTGNKPAAVRHYAAYCDMLKAELGIVPGEPIRHLSDWF